jgi:MFS transporter, PPP family, 3-phenylpropionic acid transporter
MSPALILRLLYFLIFCCTASWLPVLADYLKSKNLSGLQIGFVLSLTPLLMFVVQPFYGLFSDRIGYKRSLWLSSVLGAISFGLYLLDGHGFWSICAVTISMSVFYNAIQPVLDAMALRLSAQDSSLNYGSLRIAGAVGWSATGILIGYIIDGSQLNNIFIVSAVSLLLIFVLSFFLPTYLTDNLEVEQLSFKGLGQILFQKQLLILLLVVVGVSAGSTCIYYFYSLYMKQNGASASLVGYALSFQGLCELPFFFFATKIINRFGLKNTLMLTIFATVLRMVLYATISNPNLAVGIEVLQGVAWSLFWVVCVEYVNAQVTENYKVTGQSLLYAAFYGIGAILGNLWTGYLYEQGLPLAQIFLINIVFVLVVGCLAFVKLKDTKNVA